MTQLISVEAAFVESTIDSEDKACEILQPVMDKAYELYQKNPRWDFGEFLMHLDVDVRHVVAIGKLNQQVCNGGFIQWRDNGYDEKPNFLIQALATVNTDSSKRVSTLVYQALDIDTEPDCDDPEDEEFEYEQISEAFEPLDDEFYKFNKELLCDTAKWWLHRDVHQVIES